MARNLLIVEDDRDLASNLIDFLEVYGYTADYASDGMSALTLAQENAYDLIVLDLSLPRMDGLRVCRQLRENQQNRMPIVVLTAKDDIETKIAAFDIGADDYVVKPASLREVEVRIRALIRRTQGGQETEALQVGDLRFDIGTMKIARAGVPISLAPVPAKILLMLMRQSPNVVHRLAINRELWGNEDHSESHALIVHMHALRNAVDKPFDRQLIHTVRGFGYRIAQDESAL
ncbi:MAG: response regulator transcription factor [Rhodocyclales bacterium]|nr:response regulator transcription factor [Rhodocyclales bacterium]